MTPDQRNIVGTAVRNIDHRQIHLDLDEFCVLFKDMDSVCRSLLPRKNSKCFNTESFYNTRSHFIRIFETENPI